MRDPEWFCPICDAVDGATPLPNRVARRERARLVRAGRAIARPAGTVGRALVRVDRAAGRALQRALTIVGPTFVFVFLAILGVELATAVILFDHGAEHELIVLIAGGLGLVSAECAVRLDALNRGGPGTGAMSPVPA